jgi:hypothetical protein
MILLSTQSDCCGAMFSNQMKLMKLIKMNWSKIIRLSLGGAMAGILCGSLQRAEAAVLAEYLFNASTGASTDGDANSAANTFSSVNFGQSFANAGFPGNATISIRGDTAMSDTISGTSDYFSFTITPNATPGLGFRLNLTSLTFDFADSFNGAHRLSYEVRSSVDNFAAAIAGGTGTTTAASTWASENVNLTGGAFTFFDNTAVTFHILVADDNAATGFGYLDNVVLNGNVTPVPEPINVALAVFGLSLAGAGVGRRLYSRSRA